MFYSVFKGIIRVALKLYFSRIDVEGIENIPKNAPVLFTPNHQNAFLDAFIVGVYSPVPIYFLARSDIFKWWTKLFLKLLHVSPIYRIRDGYSKLSKNRQVFDGCTELFKEGKSQLIFPEGNHGEHYYLRPLTKGAARIALQANQAVSEGIYIQPVGLNYFNHTQPDSRVLIVFGKPIRVSDFEKEENSVAVVTNKLRDKMAYGMKKTLLIPEFSEEYELQKRSLFKKGNDSLDFNSLKKMKPEDYEVEKASFSLKFLAWIFNPIPFLVIWLVLKEVKDIVFHSSLKFAIGLVLFPIWWLFLLFYINYTVGILASILLVLFAVLSLFISYKWLK